MTPAVWAIMVGGGQHEDSSHSPTGKESYSILKTERLSRTQSDKIKKWADVIMERAVKAVTPSWLFAVLMKQRELCDLLQWWDFSQLPVLQKVQWFWTKVNKRLCRPATKWLVCHPDHTSWETGSGNTGSRQRGCFLPSEYNVDGCFPHEHVDTAGNINTMWTLQGNVVVVTLPWLPFCLFYSTFCFKLSVRLTNCKLSTHGRWVCVAAAQKTVSTPPQPSRR